MCIFTVRKGLLQALIVYSCHHCLVPYPRAQLFMYHNLQPSQLFSDVSQKALEKSFDSRRMAKVKQEEGIPVWGTLE